MYQTYYNLSVQKITYDPFLLNNRLPPNVYVAVHLIYFLMMKYIEKYLEVKIVGCKEPHVCQKTKYLHNLSIKVFFLWYNK